MSLKKSKRESSRTKKSDVRKLKGIIPIPDKPVSIEEMKEAIIAGATTNNKHHG